MIKKSLAKKIIYSMLIIYAISFLVACTATQNHNEFNHNKKELKNTVCTDIVTVTTRATDSLIDSCIIDIDNNQNIIVTSLVNIDNLKQSSTLGRMSSEMIANRMAQNGYSIQEIKMGHRIFVRVSEGEFILSRELHEIGKKHDVQGFVVGTYAINKNQFFIDNEIIVSLRYVDTNNLILCSHNYIIKNTDSKMWQ